MKDKEQSEAPLQSGAGMLDKTPCKYPDCGKPRSAQVHHIIQCLPEDHQFMNPHGPRQFDEREEFEEAFEAPPLHKSVSQSGDSVREALEELLSVTKAWHPHSGDDCIFDQAINLAENALNEAPRQAADSLTISRPEDLPVEIWNDNDENGKLWHVLVSRHFLCKNCSHVNPNEQSKLCRVCDKYTKLRKAVGLKPGEKAELRETVPDLKASVSVNPVEKGCCKKEAPRQPSTDSVLTREIVNDYEDRHKHLRGYYSRTDLLAIVRQAQHPEPSPKCKATWGLLTCELSLGHSGMHSAKSFNGTTGWSHSDGGEHPEPSKGEGR